MAAKATAIHSRFLGPTSCYALLHVVTGCHEQLETVRAVQVVLPDQQPTHLHVACAGRCCTPNL